MRGTSLRRHVATAMSVVGVLAVGTAAAAINVRLLHSASAEPARLAMQTTGGMTVLNVAPSATPSAMASATPVPASPSSAVSTGAPAAPSASQATGVTASKQSALRTSTTAAESSVPQGSPTVSARATVSSATTSMTRPLALPAAPPTARPLATPRLDATPRTLAGISVAGNDDGNESDQRTDGEERRLAPPPQLTVAQMNVLRIAAMAHVRPEVVIAAAKGDADPQTRQTLMQIAQYIGVDLASLADVPSVPRLGDRWHGNPNEHGGTNSDY